MIPEIQRLAAATELALPSFLVAAAAITFYIHRNTDKFRAAANKLRDILEYEARERDPIFGKHAVSRDIAYKLDRLGLPFNYNAFLATNVAVSLMLAATSVKLLANPRLAVLTLILWPLFAHQLVDRMYRTRVKAKIDAQAELVLQLLAELDQVSDNLVQAVERVIPATPQPLRDDLEQLILKVQTNEDLDRCLVDFALKTGNRDIETFVHGIVLANHFGTSTHEVILKSAGIIRERIEIREELLNETRGKKVVTYLFMVVLPVIFVWLFTGSEDARKIFTGTAKGQNLVCLLAAAEYICWYFDSRKGVAEEL
jgi:Flp pilus assembly protein TadB